MNLRVFYLTRRGLSDGYLAYSGAMGKTHIKSRAILQCLTRWHGALWM